MTRAYFGSRKISLVLLVVSLAAISYALAWRGAAAGERRESSGTASSAQDRHPANPFLSAQSDWPGWSFVRGPNYDGRSPEVRLADSWPPEGPPVLWTRELGQGYSAFVAAADRVYTQTQSLTGQYVVCLEADTGETIWEYRYEWPYEALGVYPGPRATPTVHEGRVYFAAPSGLIGCLTGDKGELCWSVNLKEEYDGQGTQYGYACSPVVTDGKVFLPVGGKGASMVALDTIDGTIVWKSGDDPSSYNPALPITLNGQQQVVGYLQNCLVGCDPTTGKQLWRWKLSQGYDEHSAWPIYSEPYLWISGPFRSGSQLLKLSENEGENGECSVESVWRRSVMSNDVASSVLVDGFLYGFDLRDPQSKTHRPSRGRFCCVEFLTGDEQWSVDSLKTRRRVGEAAGVNEVGHACVRAADGKLILFNDTGELILAHPNPERYEELARVSVLGGEIVWTAPTLHRGRLYVRNHTRAACVYLGRPELLEVRGTPPTLTAADIPQGEYRDLAAAILRIEPEYAFDVPSMRWFREWYLISLFGLLGLPFLVTVLVWLPFRRTMTGARFRGILWLQAFLLGAVGTTVLSGWRNEFVFTWPVSLFAAFQVAVYEIRLGKRTEQHAGPWWRSRLIALGFLAVCLAYFLLCRRLSLVFEWAFLAGFLLAAPFAIAAARCTRQSNGRRTWRILWEVVWTVAAFSAFYWSPVALLTCRY